jgi:hypothetical protein
VQALPTLFKILTAFIFIFLFQFILQLEISLFDAYSYMNMAKTFAGLQDWFPSVPRPPFLPFLLTPIALLRYLDATNETVFTLMHLVSLGISIGFIVVSYFLFKEVLRREFAALAAIFLVIQPGFLVNSFETMADIPGALLSNIALLLCIKYLEKNSRKLLVLVSIFSGLAVTAKYPLVTLPLAIWVAYALNSKCLNSEGWKKSFLNLFCLGFPILTLIFYLTFHFVFSSPHDGWLFQNILGGIKPYFWHIGKIKTYAENPISFILFLESQMTSPVFYFMLYGLMVCLKKKNSKIFLLWTWFVIFLSVNIFIGKHYEFRYLFPILPACYFFFAYGLQETFIYLEKKLGSIGVKLFSTVGILIFILPTMAFGREIMSFQRDIYHRSFQSKVSKESLKLVQNGGNIFWLGTLFTIYHPDKEVLENDPYYKVYHFNQNAISFFTDRATYYLNYDSPYLYSSKINEGSVLVVNPASEHLHRPNLPEDPKDTSPLFLGVVSKRKFSLSKAYGSARVFENLQTNDRIKLTYRNGYLILEEVNTSFLSNQFVLWVKILNPTGLSHLPEKTIFYFDRDREEGNLINKKDFDSLEEINLLNLKGRKYHFAGLSFKK